MFFFLVGYVALGVIAECTVFDAHPDWADPGIWMQVLFWPGFLADHIAPTVMGWSLRAMLGGVEPVYAVMIALLLAPLPVIFLSMRMARRRRNRTGLPASATITAETAPVPARAGTVVAMESVDEDVPPPPAAAWARPDRREPVLTPAPAQSTTGLVGHATPVPRSPQ